MTDEERDFVEVGRQAFLAGEPAAPTLNATVREAITEMEVGTSAAGIMTAFQEGWTNASLASGRTIHFGSPASSGTRACICRPTATPALSEDPRAVTCEGCRETEDWRSFTDMAAFADSLPEATETEPDRMVILREVRDKFVARKINGVPVDPQTAHAILTVYDSDAAKAKPEFRGRFARLPILRMAEVAWRLVS